MTMTNQLQLEKYLLEDNNYPFHFLLNDCMLSKDYSAEDLAVLLRRRNIKIVTGTIENWLRGYGCPKAGTLLILSEILEMPMKILNLYVKKERTYKHEKCNKHK